MERLVLLLGLSVPVADAYGMQFQSEMTSPTSVMINGRGPITKGDARRLLQTLASISPTRQVSALSLDSPGGNVAEAEQLSGLIGARGLAVIIPAQSQCVSACFLLLAASPHRFAAPDALVGVHSASENGVETDASLAVTTLMARDAADMGIPPAIIGKMVQTAPGRLAWLTRQDLQSMNVGMLGGETEAPVPLTTDGTTAQIAGSAPAPPPLSLPAFDGDGQDFATGRQARHAWDGWLSSLQGQYREGAAYAGSRVGQLEPGSCSGANGAHRADFTLGCEIARQRLAPVTATISGSPAYARGWTGSNQPDTPGDFAEAEYQGAYFCGRQVARLLLKLFPSVAGAPRRAILSFGPQPTSPSVPHGAFILEGSIDAHGGSILFRPVEWVRQPAGYSWLGLSGRSDDDGQTFSGRTTESDQCTVFTLKRTSGTASAR